jgi:hypothetical protein
LLLSPDEKAARRKWNMPLVVCAKTTKPATGAWLFFFLSLKRVSYFHRFSVLIKNGEVAEEEGREVFVSIGAGSRGSEKNAIS